MILWSLITQPASAFREFVAPRYRPELHYMRGPGPAYARRAVMVGARSCVVDCNLWPLCRCHISCVIDNRTKPDPGGVFTGMTLLAVVAAALVTAALVGVWVFLMTSDAMAHDALPTAAQPQGWSYPFSCCSSYDCREVADNAIGERPEGYVIKGTGELITYPDSRIKDSPDGIFHWCSMAGANDGHTICLFVPPRRF